MIEIHVEIVVTVTHTHMTHTTEKNTHSNRAMQSMWRLICIQKQYQRVCDCNNTFKLTHVVAVPVKQPTTFEKRFWLRPLLTFFYKTKTKN